MHVHFRVLKTGGGLNDRLDRSLNVFGYIDNIIPIPDGDDSIDDDLLSFKVDLDSLGQGLQADQLGNTSRTAVRTMPEMTSSEMLMLPFSSR